MTSTSRLPHHLCLATAALLIGAAPAFTQAPPGRGPGPAGGNSSLPAFITESVNPGSATDGGFLAADWYHVELPDIRIFANTSRPVTDAYATAIRDHARLLGWMLQPGIEARANPPSLFILDLTPLKSLNAEEPAPKAAPQGGGPRGGRGGGGRGPLVWQVSDLDLGVTYIPMANHGTAESANSTILGAMNNHFLIQLSTSLEVELPLWFIPAWRTTPASVTGNELYVPMAANRDERGELRDTTPLPGLPAVFAWPSSSAGIEPTHLQRLATNARLFLTWALFQDDGKNREAFWRFVRTASRQPVVTEALFREYFGTSIAEVQTELEAAWNRPGSNRAIRINLGRAANSPRITPRRATDAELTHALSEWARLAPRQIPAMAAPLHQAAHSLMSRALTADGSNPRVQASAGLLAVDSGNGPQGRAQLEAAVNANLPQPRVYFELARLRYAEATAAPAGQSGKLSEAQVAGILAPLRAGLAHPPTLAGSYDLIADTWLRSARPPTREELAPLMSAVDHFPRNLRYIGKVAVACQQFGYPAEAGRLVEHGLSFADNDTMRAAFTQLKARIVPAP